jgi:hypothetical protein
MNPSTLHFAFLTTILLALGCSSANGTNPPEDAGADRAPTDAGGKDRVAREGGSETGAPILSVDPFSKAPGSANEHEPFIAVSPTGRVAVSFASFLSSGAGITEGYRISNDSGETWGPATLFALPPGDNVQANASVAAGDDGTLYMSWGAEERTTGRANQRVYVAASATGTTAFATPVEVTDPSVPVQVYDQPRVLVTHAGVVNVAFNQTSPDGMTSWLVNARSTDGKTWKRAYAAGPGSYGSFRNEARFCRPVGSGRIFLVYVDSDVAYYLGDLAVALRYSDDDGASWSSPVAVTTAEEEMILDASANLGCVTSGNDVWLYYGLTKELAGDTYGSSAYETTMTDVRMAHSSDAGKSIDRHASVLDPKAGRRAMYPVLVGEGDGTLDLSYYAGNFDDDPKAELRRTRSTDGVTFPPTHLVHAPLTLETNRAAPQWIGDYVGGAYHDGNLYLVFTDNAATTTHIAFYRTPVALPARPDEPKPWTPPADSGSDAGCYTGAAFSPIHWSPPTAFGQAVCTPAQLSAYLSCTGPSCASFRAAPANAACLACLETDESASAHGPFVTTAGDGGVTVAELNYGGCQAHFDGHTGKGCCGEQSNDFQDCIVAECQTCSDFSNPSQTGPTYTCYFTAIDDGVCTAYRETTDCSYETLEGGSAGSCADPNTFVNLWCGM